MDNLEEQVIEDVYEAEDTIIQEDDNIVEEENSEVSEDTQETIIYSDKKSSEVFLVNPNLKGVSEDTKPLYHVRKEFNDYRTELGTYTSFDEAIKICNTSGRYRVYNSRGSILHYSELVKKPISKVVAYEGMKVKLFGLKAFKTTTTLETEQVYGEYYVVGYHEASKRYKLSKDKQNIGTNRYECCAFKADII